MNKLLIVFLGILMLFGGCTAPAKKVFLTIRAIIPQSGGIPVYITGNTPVLKNWQPAGVQLHRINDSTFGATIQVDAGKTIEYKITAGNWLIQAIYQDGTHDNQQITPLADTTVLVTTRGWLRSVSNGKPIIEGEPFLTANNVLQLEYNWKFRSGDNGLWAEKEYNDKNWTSVNRTVLFNSDIAESWQGIGWFRYHFLIDSVLKGKTIGCFIGQLGASDIYYNGRKIYSVGRPAMQVQQTIHQQNRIWFPLQLDTCTEQVLSVRYANHHLTEQMTKGFEPGFVLYLSPLPYVLENRFMNLRQVTILQVVFTVIPLILFFIHSLLYIFYRENIQNLWYSLCLLGFAGLTYFNYEKFIVTDADWILRFYGFSNISAICTILFGTIFAYSVLTNKLPKHVWFLIITGVFLCLLLGSGFWWRSAGNEIYIYFALCSISVFLFSRFRKNKQRQFKGGWILLTGFLALVVFITLQILIEFGILEFNMVNGQVYVYGMVSLAIAMSVFLSYNFAETNKDLTRQIIHGEQLSAQMLEKEREAGKLAIERKIIEMENERKSKELESARELQLSLLPAKIPESQNYSFSFYMQTAAEVGGDYYDIFNSSENSCLIAIGDATGHGVKAGTLVAMVKSMLHDKIGTKPLPEVLEDINRVILHMRLGNLFMGLALLELNDDSFTFSAAGMPPMLLYSASNETVTDFTIKRLPLGATNRLGFSTVEASFCSGDVLILVSDGMTELFNENDELYGVERLKQFLLTNARLPVEALKEKILQEITEWSGSAVLRDDLSIVMIKCS